MNIFLNIDEGEGGKLSASDFKKAHLLSMEHDSPSNEMSFNNLNDSLLFEGDIETDDEDSLGYFNDSLSDATAWKNRTWDYKNGSFVEIPYTLPDNNLLTENDTTTIARAIWEFRRRTCIKYDSDYIYQLYMIKNDSSIGMTKFNQINIIIRVCSA